MIQSCSAQAATEAASWAFGQFLDAPLPDRRLKKTRSGSKRDHSESATCVAQGLRQLG